MKGKLLEEMLEKFMNFKAAVENKSEKRIKILKTDGGREYQRAIVTYLRKKGIIHETTALYTLEQNGLSKRATEL